MVLNDRGMKEKEKQVSECETKHCSSEIGGQYYFLPTMAVK